MLESSENWIESALELSRVGAWQYDRATGELLWSEGCASLFGLSPTTRDDTWEDFLQRVCPEDRPHLSQQLLQTLESKASYRAEFRILLPNGTVRWLLQTGRRVAKTEGSGFRILGIIQDISDRKRVELHLNRSQQFLTQAIDAIPDPLFVKDRQHRWVLLNQAACTLMGRDREELLGLSDYDVFPALEAAAFWKQDELVLATGRENKTEGTLTDATGQTRVISTKKSVFQDAEGKQFLIGTIRDITQRKQAEDALRQQETQYRSIFQAVSDGIFINDLKTGEIIEANAAACQLHGYSHEELLGKYPTDLIHPDYQYCFADFLETVQAGHPFEVQALDIRQDGTMFEVEVKGTLCTYNGKSHGLSIVRDISDRISTESALAESEAKFRHLVENANDIIYSSTLEGIFTYISPKMVEVSGYSTSELLGKSFADFVRPEDLPLCIDRMEQILETGQTDRGVEFRAKRKDGSWYWLAANDTPIKDASGQIVGWQGVARDISDRKALEGQLAEQQELLNAFITASPVGIAILDEELRYLQINDTLAELNGLPVAEHFGKTIAEVLLPDILPAVEGVLQEVLRTGQPILGVEASGQTPKFPGEVRTQLVSYFPIPLQKGRSQRIGIVTYDISDRKQAEEAQARLTAILESTSDFVGISNMEGRNLYMNQAGRTLFAIDPTEDISNLTISDLIPTSIKPMLLEEAIPIAIREGVWRGETAMLSRSGQEIPVSQVVIAHKAPDGKPEYLSTIVRDIRDRKQIEEKLKEKVRLAAFRADVDIALTQNDSLSGILTRCTDAVVNHLDAAFARIWLLNPQDNVLELQASSGIYTHLDGPHSRIPVGKYKIGRIAQESQPHLTNSVLDDPYVSDKEWAKREKMVAFAGYPLMVDGHLIGVIALFARQALPNTILQALELSANEIALGIRRKQAEDALRQQTQQLEQTLQELQKTQAQLIQTEKMSSLGQMVAGIAHEINNPINFIHGNLSHADTYIQDLLRLIAMYQDAYPQATPDIEAEIEAIDLDFVIGDLSKLLSSMKVGTERIREIVLSLRNFSRLDEAAMKPVDIHEGINSTLLILRNRLKAKPDFPEIQVIQEYGVLPKVECYAGQLNQVFMNLIANAIEALEEQGSRQNSSEKRPQIRIRTEVLNDYWIAIAIADNGLGMTEEVKNKLFDPFFTTKPVGKGTGLGLSIAYQIVVEKHQGYLRCDSTPGEGTTFHIEIPIEPVLSCSYPTEVG